MASAEVVSTHWEKIPALELRAGDMRALVLPGIGGNVLSFGPGRDSYLRSPRDLHEYLSLPEAYGIPVLFPPNRIEGGEFTARGVRYRLPLNKHNHTQHYHGFLYERPWQVDRIGGGAGTAEIEMSFTAGTKGELYRWFPHPFRACLYYRLEVRGLFQRISFENLGDRPMPFMQGFHTAFALRDRETNPEAYRIRVDLGDEINGGGIGPLQGSMAEFRPGKILHDKEAIFGHFCAAPFQDGQEPGNAVIENLNTGARLHYTIDEQYRYRVLWNQGGDNSFICIEPQTCAINAANMHGEKDLFGFKMLGPSEQFTAECSFCL
ncbi:MAG: aldose 1-epimerase [Treponema sp.]|nr:aldose 1-epimerase [Treponema sp.]